MVRNGRVAARTTHLSYTDRHVKAGHTYRYAVRGVDKHGQRGNISDAVRVKVPMKKTVPSTGSPAPPPVTPVDPGPAPVLLSALMADRLFWRAGFGPTPDQRAYWTGRPHAELVDWMLNTPPSRQAIAPPPLTSGNATINPLASDDEMVMEWLDQMQKVPNPLPERLAFFWHRHWAISIEGAIPGVWMLNYRNRLRTYADLPGNPGLTFRSIAYDMTTADGAMSAWLNGSSYVRGSPNENYAREFMELFCLGGRTGPTADRTPRRPRRRARARAHRLVPRVGRHEAGLRPGGVLARPLRDAREDIPRDDDRRGQRPAGEHRRRAGGRQPGRRRRAQRMRITRSS